MSEHTPERTEQRYGRGAPAAARVTQLARVGDQVVSETYEYERDGERFRVGTGSGVLYESAEQNGERRTLARVPGPLPADVVASTVVELALSGWVPATSGLDAL